jgi:hypothetical protein
MPLKITVLDVNDNSPEIVDPQGDVVSVREEQPPGTEVAKVRALDTDLGENASVTYSILKGEQMRGFVGTWIQRDSASRFLDITSLRLDRFIALPA